MSGTPLRLFEATGIEIEYMIVDRDSLAVRPIADELIKAEAGSYESEIERGDIAWSNELALHVLELKTNGPARRLEGLARRFQVNVRDANRRLEPMNAMLMPSAMHPWMDPERELRLWPHEYNPVYEAFDRIFDCRGHGWANLQSVHLNLPFADDEEFGRLHAAMRFLLPIMPALAASSPIVAGRLTGHLDSRLDVYRKNTVRIPSVTAAVIPEPVYSRAEYEERILATIYRDLAPFDPKGILRDEWVNARGCIARFDRMTIEVRLLDVQECPRADLAIAAAVSACARALCDTGSRDQLRLRALDTARLAAILDATTARAGAAVVDDAEYLALLGCDGRARTAAEVWRQLVATHASELDDDQRGVLAVLLDEGCLAQRLLRRAGTEPDRGALRTVYAELCDCLREGRLLRAAG